MFFERRCPICERPATAVCDRCWDRLEPGRVRWLASPEPTSARDLEVRSLVTYSPEAAAMLLAAKNGGRRQVLRQLGQALACSLSLERSAFDCVTWIPASTTHRRERGFDQGRLLARTVAAGLDLPARSLLARSSRGSDSSQKGKGRTDRLLGATLVATRPTTARVLLIDDVITTGASLRHGADALYLAGAQGVMAATGASADQRRQRSPEVTFGPQSGSRDPA